MGEREMIVVAIVETSEVTIVLSCEIGETRLVRPLTSVLPQGRGNPSSMTFEDMEGQVLSHPLNAEHLRQYY